MKQKNRTKPNFGNQIRHSYFKKDTQQVVWHRGLSTYVR